MQQNKIIIFRKHCRKVFLSYYVLNVSMLMEERLKITSGTNLANYTF